MYRNIGKKIKIVAMVQCGVGILVSIIGAVAMFSMAGKAYGDSVGLLVFGGFSCLVLGSLASWVSSFILYGFGELVQNSITMAQGGTAPLEPKPAPTRVFQASSPKQDMPKLTCPKCGEIVRKMPCPVCGYDPEQERINELDALLQAGLITQEEYDSKKNRG